MFSAASLNDKRTYDLSEVGLHGPSYDLSNTYLSSRFISTLADALNILQVIKTLGLCSGQISPQAAAASKPLKCLNNYEMWDEENSSCI